MLIVIVFFDAPFQSFSHVIRRQPRLFQSSADMYLEQTFVWALRRLYSTHGPRPTPLGSVGPAESSPASICTSASIAQSGRLAGARLRPNFAVPAELLIFAKNPGGAGRPRSTVTVTVRPPSASVGCLSAVSVMARPSGSRTLIFCEVLLPANTPNGSLLPSATVISSSSAFASRTVRSEVWGPAYNQYPAIPILCSPL